MAAPKLALAIALLMMGGVFVTKPATAQSASIRVAVTVLSTGTAQESFDRAQAEAAIASAVAQNESLAPRRTMTPSGMAAVVSERVPAVIADSSRPGKPAPSAPPATENRLRITISYVAN